MPKNYTENYHLSQWEPEDAVLREDFNADNAAVDAALDGLEQTVTSLSGTVQEHTSKISKLGNCRIEQVTYYGVGGTSNSVHISANTRLLVINGENGTCLVALRGVEQVVCTGASGAGAVLDATWSSNSVTLQYRSGNLSAVKAVCNETDVYYSKIMLIMLS